MNGNNWWRQLLIAGLTAIIAAAAGYYFSQVKAREAEEMAKERLFYNKMILYLDASNNAFNNQVDMRNRLFHLLNRNHAPLTVLEYEELCRKYYRDLNEEERYVFQKVRGLTETLYEYNDKMKQEIESNPEVYVKLPLLNDLNEHLSLWISKYKSVFKENEEACLVYVGVEEGKPFPTGIEKEIESKLREL